MIGSINNELQFQEAALRLREQRQQLLASNIANADTPNYKARDFNFNQALQGVLARNASTPTAMAQTASGHMPGVNDADFGGAPLQYRTVQQGSVDGNTVDMDTERNQFTDNALRYEASLTMITGRIKDLLAAMQGG
ncbi:flagellar basal body rod protein FlgB [Sulfuriferula thiophila]|uniref:flagellar basal body rod protein FlgB n=1 Tax=Sulfuriferula thiophila TaxID=1781211 RepID=UPI000F611E24|nr:flagellar basal body rod protein FlgB [Sulfuriferula thiophila]